jgi:hypothetical protein
MSWVSSNDPGEAGDTVVAVAPLHTAQNLAQQASIGVRRDRRHPEMPLPRVVGARPAVWCGSADGAGDDPAVRFH